jgi:5-(carboxyamino)imidazole ribonucleotide mutase
LCIAGERVWDAGWRITPQSAVLARIEGPDAMTYSMQLRPTEEESMPGRVTIIMGSASDGETMKSAADVLGELGIEHETLVISAHRTPDRHLKFVESAEANGVEVIIAAAGMAAHLAGVTAAHTILPVLGVPMAGGVMGGLDALLSTVQMPGGIPVATFAVGRAGAKNAALFAAAILAAKDPAVRKALEAFRERQTDAVPEHPA